MGVGILCIKFPFDGLHNRGRAVLEVPKHSGLENWGIRGEKLGVWVKGESGGETGVFSSSVNPKENFFNPRGRPAKKVGMRPWARKISNN